jgi:hypothetical protein
MQVLQTGRERYQPERRFDHHALVDQKKLAFIVGLVAFSLPTLFWIGSNLLGGCYRLSISHFYYAPFWGGPFIGALVFIGAYLIVYKGECGEERLLATVAGFCALGVGLLPTSGHGCAAPNFRARAFASFERLPDGGLGLTPDQPIDSHFLLQTHLDLLHVLSAGLLFAILAWFSLAIFTRIVDDRHRHADGKLRPVKIARNTVYVACGAAILTALAVLIGVFAGGRFFGLDLNGWNASRGTFKMEAIALYAFGISWMVRGRFLNTFLKDREE